MKRGFLISAILALCTLQIGSAQVLEQQILDIPSGQYSGITPLYGPLYAVVHDKSSGGGLHLFTLQFLPDGTLQQARALELYGNASQEAGKDNEDVVYVPETGTLWVSAEGDQSIREYNRDGFPTGRELKVPDKLKKCSPNAGFEALAYRDGHFWTTTECPLPGEDSHRLLTFSLQTLRKEKEVRYRMDAPVGKAEGTSAYAHGISALTALPDGRLAVLEREICVPGGGLRERLRAFSATKIYLINPEAPAEKFLLARILCGPLNLANYEGMCLGPQVDGKQTLLLLADSQDSAGGLIPEYIQLIITE